MASIFQDFDELMGSGRLANEDGSFGNWFTHLVDPMSSEQSYNAWQADRDRVFQSKEAEKSWQRNLEASSTAYSRAVNDLKSVGVNPYAAISSGFSAASTPAPSQARSSGHGSVGAHASIIPALVSSAMSLAGVLVGQANRKPPEYHTHNTYVRNYR